MGLIADIHKDLEIGALQLIAEYRARLHDEAVKLCGDGAQVDDLVFRTFEQVLTKVDSYKVDTNLFGWMKSIMENIHRNDTRGPVVRCTKVVPPEELEQYAGFDCCTDEQVLRNSDCEMVRKALRNLPPEYKQTVILRFYEELSLKEIASFLNKPVGTVSRRIHVALRLLAGKLGAEVDRAKKPLAVLLAALLGIGSLFGAWQAGLLDPLLSQITDAARSGEAESFPLQEEALPSGAIAQAIGEALPESFPLQEEMETDLTQEESQSETTKEQTMNLKAVKAVAASAAILAGALGASAEEQAYWTYDATAKTISDGVWVLNVTESKGELTVTGQNAATVVGTDMTCDLSKPVSDGKTIVGIGGSAFANKTNLKVMKFPETMRSIGADAFKSCSKLTTITPFMPAAVTFVGQQAFWSTSLAGDLVLGEKDGSELTLSGVRSFCSTKITSVTIEAPLKNGTLPASFGACSSLTNVVLRGNVTAISSGAFGSCAKLADFHVSTFVTSWAADAISGPAAYGMRLWVDKTNPSWRIWIAENVTPWDGLDGETKAIYDANFGASAPRPVGLVTGAGAQPANQWVMLWDQGGEPVLWPMEVKATGYEGLEDGEPHGITVTVTTPKGGFGCSYEWSADGGETWSADPTNFVAAGTYTVTCRVSSEGFETTEVSATVILHGTGDDHWTYDSSAKTISDGVWVLKVTESSGKLTVTGVAAGTDYRSDMTCDLSKPIDGGLEIVTLGASAFNGYGNNTGKYLTTMRFPETLQSIGGDAFKSCSHLTTVTPFLPAALTTVGQQAFYDCTSLAGDLVLGQEDGSVLTLSGVRGFCSAKKITSVTINADIGNGTLPGSIFSGCTSITNVVLRGNVTTISSGAFAGCTKLTDFYVSSFVTSWAADAITGPATYGMRLWVDKTNPEWKTWIADDTKVLSWDGLDAVTKAKYDENFGEDAPRPAGLVTGDGVQPASQWVMLWDQGGEPVLWPMEVTATGYEGLVDGQPHNITVTVTKPVDGAGCSYEWSLDGGVTWSDDLPNLTAAGVYTVTCRVSAEGFETTEVSATVTLHGAADDHWTYDSSTKTISDGVWVLNVTESKGELTIKSVAAGTDYRSGMEADLSKPVGSGQTIVALGDGAFNGFNNKTGANLTAIKFPETLRSIGGDAFKSCSYLTTVTPFLPAALTSIGNQAFYGCTSLMGDVVIGQVGGSEVTFGAYRIFNGTKISSAKFDSAIGGGTLPIGIFGGCKSLTNAVLRAGVTTISDSAFASCTKLADLYLGAFVTSWADTAFSGATANYTMRLWVDMYGKEWDGWIAANVTPWNELDGDMQGTFYDNFGANAKRPVGLIAASSAQLPLQWLARWYPNGPKRGFMVILQ